MAYQEALRYLSLRVPSTAYSARQFRLVKADSTAGYFVQCSTAAGAGNAAIGVLQDAPTVAGEACQIGRDGVTKLLCGSTKLSAGKMFVTATSGAAGSTANAGAKQVIYGPWLSAAAAAGTVGSAVFQIVGITT